MKLQRASDSPHFKGNLCSGFSSDHRPSIGPVIKFRDHRAILAPNSFNKEFYKQAWVEFGADRDANGRLYCLFSTEVSVLLQLFHPWIHCWNATKLNGRFIAMSQPLVFTSRVSAYDLILVIMHKF